MLSLLPPSNDFLAFESFSSLANLLQFSQNDKDAFQPQCLGTKSFFLNKFNKKTHKCLGDIRTLMYTNRNSFPNVYSLLVGVTTFGSSTAICEASILTLSRVLTPFGQSMTHQRKLTLSSWHSCTNIQELLIRTRFCVKLPKRTVDCSYFKLLLNIIAIKII